jgi:hypothetical protein
MLVGVSFRVAEDSAEIVRQAAAEEYVSKLTVEGALFRLRFYDRCAPTML